MRPMWAAFKAAIRCWRVRGCGSSAMVEGAAGCQRGEKREEEMERAKWPLSRQGGHCCSGGMDEKDEQQGL